MATNELNENYETERRTFVENLFEYEISDDDCESDRGNASGNESKQVVAVGPQPYRFEPVRPRELGVHAADTQPMETEEPPRAGNTDW